MPQNKHINKQNTTYTNDKNKNDNKEHKIIKRKKVKTSIKKKKAKSLTNVKSSIKKNKNKDIATKVPKKNNKKMKSKSLTTIHKKQKGGYSETTDSELCSRDINDLLATNKKIFTYNQPGNQFESMKKDGIASQEMAKKGWGSNPGPPPDPSKCVIM
jgi:hypothetical protein